MRPFSVLDARIYLSRTLWVTCRRVAMSSLIDSPQPVRCSAKEHRSGHGILANGFEYISSLRHRLHFEYIFNEASRRLDALAMLPVLSALLGRCDPSPCPA